MKIDSTYKPVTPPITNRPVSRSPQEASSSAESVSLSQLAGTIQGAEKPPVNAARIQEIKDAISQGRFKVNPEAIADGLIQSARDLLDSQRKA
ncbi:MAG: flagellar biosynthesis anti-sigma factor FlgM [Betaproteobacteria bacterium HGW-Betaproteobacteria-6]|jgi:negative regulator of flagellin synthesis FlgM|nr:MAG: flagellar biosynthesis anti-sigma factor FlgM [Betaproteobacteria bacterium HGW-Betaproteobacteria-6]